MDQRAKGSKVLLKARFPICVHGPVWEKIITVLLGLQRKTHERCWSIHIHPDISSHEGEKNFFLTSLFWVGHIKCVAVLSFVDSPLALLQGSYQTWQRGHHPMREMLFFMMITWKPFGSEWPLCWPPSFTFSILFQPCLIKHIFTLA